MNNKNDYVSFLNADSAIPNPAGYPIPNAINIINETNKLKYAKSHTKPNTLYNFTKNLEWLEWSIINKRLSPRYNIEDFSYMKVKGFKRIAFPMKCFCDINLHQLKDHLDWYGYYGLGFNKEWGMEQKIQPVQYINPSSRLLSEFSDVLKKSIKSKVKPSEFENLLLGFITHQLLYIKPYSGNVINPQENKRTNKCFLDESEWRYIPEKSSLECSLVLSNEEYLNDLFLTRVSNVLQSNTKASLKFEYSDLKYVVVNKISDFELLLKKLEDAGIDDRDLHILISKFIIWETSKEDF